MLGQDDRQWRADLPLEWFVCGRQRRDFNYGLSVQGTAGWWRIRDRIHYSDTNNQQTVLLTKPSTTYWRHAGERRQCTTWLYAQRDKLRLDVDGALDATQPLLVPVVNNIVAAYVRAFDGPVSSASLTGDMDEIRFGNAAAGGGVAEGHQVNLTGRRRAD